MTIAEQVRNLIPNLKQRKLEHLQSIDKGLYNEIMDRTKFVVAGTNLNDRLWFQ